MYSKVTITFWLKLMFHFHPPFCIAVILKLSSTYHTDHLKRPYLLLMFAASAGVCSAGSGSVPEYTGWAAYMAFADCWTTAGQPTNQHWLAIMWNRVGKTQGCWWLTNLQAKTWNRQWYHRKSLIFHSSVPSKVLRNDVMSHVRTVESLNQAGRGLLEAGPGDSPHGLQSRLEHLNESWEFVCCETERRQLELENKLSQVNQKHTVQYQQMRCCVCSLACFMLPSCGNFLHYMYKQTRFVPNYAICWNLVHNLCM